MWSNQTSSTAVSWSQTDWIDEGILKTPISLVFPRALQSAVCCQRLVVINRLAWKAHGVLTNPWRQSLWARLKPICKWPTESDLQNKACMLLDRQGHNSHHDRKCALNDRLEMVPLILVVISSMEQHFAHERKQMKQTKFDSVLHSLHRCHTFLLIANSTIAFSTLTIPQGWVSAHFTDLVRNHLSCTSFVLFQFDHS